MSNILNKSFLFNGNIVNIYDGLLPDETVNAFLDKLDDAAQEKFRHIPIMDNEYQYFAIASEGNSERIVGYGAVYPRDVGSPEACLAIVLAEDYRGMGLGTLMYQAGEDLAAKQGKKYFRAETDADNEPALATMRSLGWEVYGPIYIVKKVFDEGKVSGPTRQLVMKGNFTV